MFQAKLKYVVCIVFSLICLSPCMAAAQSDLVKRGEYLSHVGDCRGCHTADKNKPFAGGRAIESPFGTFYSPNITPDPETGIGNWTEADFKRALHRGLDKEGDYLYPVMPYVSYTKLMDDDIKALWAYMQSIEPVHNKTPEHDLVFPVDVRLGLAAWQGIYFEPGRFQPDPGKNKEYNRGAYLVQALGHCSSCHTPRNILLAQEKDKQFTGAEIHHWYAPDISSSPRSAIEDWSISQLAMYLKTGETDTNIKAVGEMHEVIHNSLRYLSDDDIHAMALYLKTMPPPAEKPALSEESEIPAERFAAGRMLYAEYCLGCHQATGGGSKGAAPALAGNPSVTASQPDNAIMAMLQGFAPQEEWGGMPSFAGALNNREIADIANYIRTAWGNNGEPNATASMVNQSRGPADMPAEKRDQVVTCPNLPAEILEPALAAGSGVLKDASHNRSQLTKLVSDYRTARQDSSVADIVEALTTAYCRVVADEDISYAEKAGRIASFSQQAAIAALYKEKDSSQTR